MAQQGGAAPRGHGPAAMPWPPGGWDVTALPLGARVAWPEEPTAGQPVSWAPAASNPLAAYTPDVLADMLLLDSAHAARCAPAHTARAWRPLGSQGSLLGALLAPAGGARRSPARVLHAARRDGRDRRATCAGGPRPGCAAEGLRRHVRTHGACP